MKIAGYFLTLSLILLGSACHGTEVGNGRSVSPNKDSESPESGKNTSSPDESQVPTGETDGQQETAEEHLFVGCASPMAEADSATFVESDAYDTYTVVINGSSWTAASEREAITYQGSRTPTTEDPYKITSSSSSSSLECSSVTTEATKRTVIFADGYQLIWTLDTSNRVDTIEIYNSDDELLRTYTRQ